jgi:hypothetical protein
MSKYNPIVHKRKFFIMQTCLEYMRKNCPEEYRGIVKEAYRLVSGNEARKLRAESR